jgi:hypothetical protein
MTCGYYLTSSPVTALPMIMRWISDVPSKMVKLVEVRAVSAGRRPAVQAHVSTNSAPQNTARMRRFWHDYDPLPRQMCVNPDRMRSARFRCQAGCRSGGRAGRRFASRTADTPEQGPPGDGGVVVTYRDDCEGDGLAE